MSSDKDKVRRMLQEERDRVDSLAREIALRGQEDESKKIALPSDEEDKTLTPLQAILFIVKPIVKPSTGTLSTVGDWEKVVEDYQKKYPDTPVTNNALKFPVKEDGIQFFTAQATSTPPRKFFVRQVDQDGKPTGDNIGSCGDGKLYRGTLQEIQADLQSSLKANPNDANIQDGLDFITRTIAQDLKARLHDAKEEAPKASLEENNDPNLLSIKPSM